MKKTILFATDPQTNEILVSESASGRNTITPLARIPRAEHPLLFDAVDLLTRMTTSPQFDAAVFNALNKVCEMMYEKVGKQG